MRKTTLKIPKTPAGKKIIAKYMSNTYINIVCDGVNYIEYYLWDGVSEEYDHILYFPKLK